MRAFAESRRDLGGRRPSAGELAGEDALLPPRQDLLTLETRHGRRCLVPLSSLRTRLSGSRMLPAYRRAARAHRAALRSWIALGGGRLTHRVTRRPGDGWPLADLLRADLPTLATAAASIRTGPEPRIALQLMDADGSILAYAKYAEAPCRRADLANEARMLAVLPAGIGPSLIRFTPFCEGVLLVQTPLPGRPYAPRRHLDPAQRRVLDRLVRPGSAYPAREHPFVERLRSGSGRWGPLLERLVVQLETAEWPVVWMHGDFTFTNLHRWRGACLAFDWAQGVEDGFPYLDAGRWGFEMARSIERRSPTRAKRQVVAALRGQLPPHLRDLAAALASLSALHTLVTRHPSARTDEYARWLTAFVLA